MFDTSKLSLDRELAGFLALEESYGVMPALTSAHAVGLLGLPKASQQQTFTDSEEKSNTASPVQRFRDATPAGSVSFSLYARPGGAAGTKPVEAAMIKAIMGVESLAADSVVYSPAIRLPSLCLAYRVGANLTQFITGLALEEVKTSGSAKGAVKHEASGKCRAVLSAGLAMTVAGSTASLIKLEAGGGRRFDPGARVQVGEDSNAGAGYTVTAYDQAADTITLDPPLAAAPGAGLAVKGCLPTISLAGSPLEGRLCPALIDGVDLTITEWTVSVARAVKMLDNVVAADDPYAAQGFLADQRTVKATCKAYFQGPNVAFFHQAKSQTRAVLALGGGGAPGQRLAIAIPRGEVNTPELQGTAPLELSLEFVAMPSPAGEDEITFTYN